jgi:hypothetical protein
MQTFLNFVDLESALGQTGAQSHDLIRDAFRGRNMIARSEIFARAAACDHQMEIAPDPARRMAYRLIRDLWIALASNMTANPSCAPLCEEIAVVEGIEAAIRQAATP